MISISVIGDEILKGQVADTNTHFITRHLFAWGVKVKKVTSTCTIFSKHLKVTMGNSLPVLTYKIVTLPHIDINAFSHFCKS